MHTGNVFFRTLILLFLFAVLLNWNPAVQSQSKEVVDMAGREIKIPASPSRVIALGPGMLRKIAYLDAIHLIAGVEEGEIYDSETTSRPYQLAYPEIKSLPIIGPDHGGDAELITGQAPDLILLQGTAEEARKLQQKLDVPVLVFEFGDIYNYRHILYQALNLLGEVLGKDQRAQELINYIEDLIYDLDQRTKDISPAEKPSIYAGAMSFRGSHGFTSVRTPFPPFEFINAPDVAGKHLNYQAMTHVSVSRELLITWDPSIIFIDLVNLHLVRDDFQRYREYRYLTAVRENQVYGLLPYASYHVNFSNVLANSYYAGTVIYPEEFADIDAEKKANEIYEKFFGQPLYNQIKNISGGFGAIHL